MARVAVSLKQKREIRGRKKKIGEAVANGVLRVEQV